MTELAVAPVDVILRDGSTLRLRAPGAADAEALVALFAGLTPESLYRRFHGFPTVDRRLAEPILDPDWLETGALIGTAAADGLERVVALASYARLRDPAVAEVAFTVADDFQGRGVATRLLEQLARRAGETGIERFVAEVMPDNRPMLNVFADAGFEVTRELDAGEVEVSFPIQPTEAYRTRVDERDHVAVVSSLRPFFVPERVAVVGASPRRGTIGGELFRNVLRADFRGVAYPVNRNGAPVAGVRAYRSVEEIDDEVDLAVLCLPAERVLEAADDALSHGVRALCVISAGFAEVGAEGEARQRELLALVRSHGARLVGPNCLGVASSAPRLNATFGPRALPPGGIGFSSQSGALGLALLEKAGERGLGFSAFVSIGNKADVSTNDLLEYWEDDEETEAVVLYVESFGNPRKFSRVARRLARSKPVLAMKSGTTLAGRRAAGSHTAALAGSDAAVDALFRQAGVIRATTLEQLLDAAVLLSSQPLPRGRRVAVLTNAGGLGILAADACEAVGLELHDPSPDTQAALAGLLPAEASLRNPVDMLGSATAATYEAVLPVVLADPRVDAVIVLFVPPVVATADEVAQAISAHGEGGKPVLAVVVSAGGIPETLHGPDRAVAAFEFPESAARALALAAERAEWLRRPAGSVPELEGVDRDAGRAVVTEALGVADDAWLRPEQARRLLEAYGVPLVAERLAADAGEAATAAQEVGYPVVVKTALPGAHKTERGGVALDLESDEAVRAAAERIGGPLVVQPLVRGGVELLAGVFQDPVFGALVAFGPGGVFAELIGEAGFRIAPLTGADAEELVNSGRAGRLVAGFRGPPAHAPSLTDLLHRLSALGEDLHEVAELDLNPVMGLPTGCVVVDARVRVRRATAAPVTKTW